MLFRRSEDFIEAFPVKTTLFTSQGLILPDFSIAYALKAMAIIKIPGTTADKRLRSGYVCGEAAIRLSVIFAISFYHQ
jgi:hypothetical protein